MKKALVNEYCTEGSRYFKTAVNGYEKRPEIFNAEILYNLLAMSIEKNFMAILAHHDDMPDNHTFTDMINSANRFIDMDETLVKDLKQLELQQNLCPVHDSFKCNELSPEMVKKMISVAAEIEQLTQETI